MLATGGGDLREVDRTGGAVDDAEPNSSTAEPNPPMMRYFSPPPAR